MANNTMADQFRGLPMGDLIGAPLTAACDAQVRLANATADFIKVIGFLPPTAEGKEVGDVRKVSFKFDRPSQSVEGKDGVNAMETVELEVPLLAVVKVPNLSINKVDISFDMEVKNSERSSETEDKSAKLSAEAKVGWGAIQRQGQHLRFGGFAQGKHPIQRPVGQVPRRSARR